MIHRRWIGSHDWKRSTDVINGYPSRNERSQTDTQDLDDLIIWLEYGKTSGYIAARQSKEQEEYWGKLVRGILCRELIIELKFFHDGPFNYFHIICSQCERTMCGSVMFGESNTGNDAIFTNNLCECLVSRESDILQYVIDEFEK